MRVTRSINAEGNVLLVVETRWRDDNSLVEYETREPTVMSIINRHQDLIVQDSLQVLDMEALRAGSGRRPAAEASERLALPMLVPLGILAFALLVIYGLSRVYLELDNDVATGLAAGIAVGILATAWFLASRPSIPGWQIASIGVVAAAVLTGGALFAVIDEDDGEATAEEPPAAASPAAGETPAAAPGDNVFDVAMIPTIQFDSDEISLPADTQVTVRADNQDTAILHNWALYESKEAAESEGPSAAIALTEICAAPCLDEVTFTAPPPGEYFFRCDVHPIQMVGTAIVE
jgi:plastocyanin